MKKLILHIGLHKTATSTIQRSCYENRDLLKEQGFTYPYFKCSGELEVNHSHTFYSGFAENPRQYPMNIKKGFVKKKNIEKLNQNLLKEFEQQCLNAQNVIISGEDISALSSDGLSALKEYFERFDFNIKVMCYVRKPYLHLCSRIQQKIRMGYGILKDNGYLQLPLSQANRINNAKKIFNDIQFYSFDAIIQNGIDPFRHFLKNININEIETFITVIENRGIGNLSTRLYNHLFFKYPIIKRNVMNSRRHNIPIVNFDNEKFNMTKEELHAAEAFLNMENLRIKEILGEHFCDSEYKIIPPLKIDECQAEMIYQTLNLKGKYKRCLNEFILQHMI